MNIVSEIKRKRQRHFRRLYLRRRETNGEYETDWQLIDSDFIMKYGKIKTSIDIVKPSYYKQSDVSFEVSNKTGYFSPENQVNSFFSKKLSIINTLVKIQTGYESDDGTEYPTNTTAFIGIIDAVPDYNQGQKVQFKAKPLTYIFNNFPADRITGLNSSLTASQIITKIRDHQDGNGVKIFQKYISLGAWNITATSNYYSMVTSTTLQNKSCWKLMQDMAEAENFIIYIDRTGDLYFNSRSTNTSANTFHFSGLGDDDRSYGHNILDSLSVEDDVDNVYNRVKIQYEKGDTTTSYYILNESWTWGDSSSSFKYGVREYKYSNEWLATATAISIANEIYTAYQRSKINVSLKSLFVPQLGINDNVDLTYLTQQKSGDDSWGYFLWGHGKWGSGAGYNINFYQKQLRIIEMNHDVDKFESDVKLREL